MSGRSVYRGDEEDFQGGGRTEDTDAQPQGEIEDQNQSQVQG